MYHPSATGSRWRGVSRTQIRAIAQRRGLAPDRLQDRQRLPGTDVLWEGDVGQIGGQGPDHRDPQSVDLAPHRPEVIEAVSEALALNVEIDELQRAASRVIARVTGAEAGCVTSSCSSAIAIGVAAAMTGADLGRIVQLPDTTGMTDEVILQRAHDVNFGARSARWCA
jgi:hypothetical protein